MPLIFVQRWAPSGPVAVTGGTQTVSGTLDVSNGMVIEYDPSLFSKATYNSATYTLFNFGTLNLGAYPDIQSAVTSDFTTTGYTTAVYTVVGNTITVTLS